jgi:hypothetical protein
MKHRGPTLRNIEGAITLPLALMFGCALFATFGAWSILRQERKSEVLELGALNCIGYRAQLFRNLQNEIEGTNSAIQITRAAIAASSLLPAALPELVAALNATVSLQETSLAAYQVQSAAWPLAGPCRGLSLYSPGSALQNTPWRRPPPDPIGQQPLESTHPQGEFHDFSMHTRAGRIERSAFAHVVFDPQQDRWTSHWGRPPRSRPFIQGGTITH